MPTQALRDVYTVVRPEQASCLLNPLRAEILARLREPASAAQVAREVGETAQRINYHVKELEKVGLVRRVGTRHVRNLVEVLYQAVARTFVLADSLGLGPAEAQQVRDQGSLGQLVNLSARLRRDALALLERSDVGAEVPSASLTGTIRLRTEAERTAFLADYVQRMKELLEKYAAGAGPADGTRPGAGDDAGGQSFSVLLAVYPEVDAHAR